jgi:Nitrile hydratase, alpha chain
MAASNEQAEAWRASYGKVVAKAWSDSVFKAKLLKDPQAVLAEAGVEMPPGVAVKVVENTQDTMHLVLPAPPPAGELTDEALDKVAGGACSSACGSSAKSSSSSC